MVRMKNEDGGGASFDGKDYPADEKGIVTVPGEAVAILRDHGFEVAKEDVAQDKKKELSPEDAAKIAELKKAIKNTKAALKRAPEDAEKKAAFDAAVLALDTFTGSKNDEEPDADDEP